MSDNKYPYIGRSEQGNDYLMLSNTFIFSFLSKSWLFEGGGFGDFKNITRKYLTNTYGKCESQEHADFICKLAENAGFTPENDYHAEKGRFWFSFNHETGSFFGERRAKDDNEKLIHLPLPPKEKEMSETKPVYTKEMHERGELPPIGSSVQLEDSVGTIELGVDVVGLFPVLTRGMYRLVSLEQIKPIPKIEDELVDILEHKWDSKALAKCLLAKYNITPKDS